MGRPRISPETEAAIRAARERGLGVLKIARKVGVGTSVIERVLTA